MSVRTPSSTHVQSPVPPSCAPRDRTVRVSKKLSPRRPTTPVFLTSFLGLASDKMARVPTAGPSRLRELERPTFVVQPDPAPRHAKRAAEDVIDLTHTTEEEEHVSGDHKRPRLATLPPPARPSKAADEAKSKQKAAKREREAQHDKMTAESITWRTKYKKAFPSFVFYFDALDHATEFALMKSVERLGATVDNFFSKKVTHVVTSRAIPVPAGNKENLSSLMKVPTPRGPTDSAAGPSRTAKRAGKQSPVSYSFLNGQKVPQHVEMLDKNPFIDAQDILSKASEFGLKIWKLDKAHRIIARINSYSPNKVDPVPTRTLSLPSLLRDEQLFGTRERDPFVPRLDTHYFPPKSCYVLVEDSNGIHRPIVIKEYAKAKKGEDPHWPVLYGGIEGRGGFYHYEGTPIVYRSRVPPAQEDENPPAVASKALPPVSRKAASLAAPCLRRSISMVQLRKNQLNDPVAKSVLQPSHFMNGGGEREDAFLAASGCSQIITSTNTNITSATSTRSGAVAPLGSKGYVDKRLAILSRSVVSLGGSAASSGTGAKGPLALAVEATQGAKLKRSMSVDGGMDKMVVPAREVPKKPGYCENCRIKYDDFKEHILARRHRRFAQNDENWIELDNLLYRITRPYKPSELTNSSPEREIADPTVAEGCEVGDSADDSAYFEGEGSDSIAAVIAEIQAKGARAQRHAAMAQLICDCEWDCGGVDCF